jgi:hypothetical protein
LCLLCCCVWCLWFALRNAGGLCIACALFRILFVLLVGGDIICVLVTLCLYSFVLALLFFLFRW